MAASVILMATLLTKHSITPTFKTTGVSEVSFVSKSWRLVCDNC